MRTSLVIIGCGGFGREAFCWIPKKYRVDAFYSNIGSTELSMFGIPVIRDLDGLRDSDFLIAVGQPEAKHKLWQIALDAGLQPCEPIIHPTAVVGENCLIGRGSILCPQSVITTNVKIGNGVILNLGATIGHDCLVGDFVTVSPGANVSGNCSIGDGSYIGTNASLREKINVEIDSVIGMGTVLLRDVPRGTTWVGNPARQIHRE